VQSSLTGIEQLFEQSLKPLVELGDMVLDVKNPTWLERFNKFKATTRDLEVMVQNVINSTLAAVRSIEAIVELLDVFQLVCVWIQLEVPC
jgi:hypothetical protein